MKADATRIRINMEAVVRNKEYLAASGIKMGASEEADLLRASTACRTFMRRVEEGAGRIRLALAAASALAHSDYYVKHWYRVPETS